MDMQLSDEQIEEFKKIHEPYGGLGEYTEDQIREIANGVANYFLTLYKIHQRIEGKKKDAKGEIADSGAV